MATPPTFSVAPVTAWTSSTSPKSTGTFSAASGDIIVGVVLDETDNGTENYTTSNSGTAQTWNEHAETIGTTSYAWAQTVDATVNATLTNQTITVTRNAGTTGNYWGACFAKFTASPGIGATSRSTAGANGAPTLDITTQYDNSAIFYACVDWEPINGATRTHRTVNGYTPTAGNGQEFAYSYTSGRYTIYVAYIVDAGPAGTKTIGISSPTGQAYSCAAVEVRGVAATDYTVTPTDDAGSVDTAAVDEGKDVTDSAGSTDPSVVSVGWGVDVTDDAGSTDTFSVAYGFGVAPVDDAGSVDASVSALDADRAPTDDAGSVDTAVYTRATFMPADDDAGSSDTAVVDLVAAGFVTRVDDAGATDAVMLTRGLAVVDAAGVTDAASVAAGFGAATIDDAGSTDTTVAASTRAVAAADETGSTDTAVYTRTIATVDNAGVTDTASVSVVGAGEITATDTAGSIDTVARNASYTRPSVDDAGSSDTAIISAGGSITFGDDAGSSDTATITVVGSVGAADTAGSTDSFTIILNRELLIVEDAGSSDGWTRLAVYTLAYVDTAGVTDTMFVVVPPAALDHMQASGAVRFTATVTGGVTPAVSVAGRVGTASLEGALLP